MIKTESVLKRAVPRAAVMCVMLALLMSLLPGAAAKESSLRFDESGQLKILIVADTQDAENPQKETMAMLTTSLDAAQPDLVVFLGDVTHGNDIKSEAEAQKAISALIAPVTERALPFAVVFGNHDDNGGVSKEAQMAIFQSFPGCLSVDGEDISGCGNYRLPVYDKTGEKMLFNLWFFDSGTYDEELEDAYDYVKQDQIDWYIRESKALQEENGGKAVPSFAFQHIIVPEIYDMLTEVPEGTDGAIRGHGSHSESYYVLNPELFSAGKLGEAPCPPEHNSGEFAAWKAQGDIVAAFFGHDHKNDFVGTYEGIDLVMTPGTGFYIYGNGDEHGTRVVTLKESDLPAYETKVLYYKDLVGKAPIGIRSIHGARYELPLALAVLALAALISAVIVLIRRKRKRAGKAA